MMNIALVTARGGSKGLPRKNILLLGGRPLLGWTIQAALLSRSIDRVFVSTEDPEISNLSLDLGAEVISRPAELAMDNTGSEPVITHAIEYLREEGIEVDNVCLLQPTSPRRNSTHIDNAFRLFKKENAKCVLSVFQPQYSSAKAYKMNEDGTIEGLLSKGSPYKRRQDLPQTYNPNGAIYLFKAIDFMEKKLIPRDQVYPFVMSEDDSVDIDTEADMKKVEMMIEGEKNV